MLGSGPCLCSVLAVVEAPRKVVVFQKPLAPAAQGPLSCHTREAGYSHNVYSFHHFFGHIWYLWKANSAVYLLIQFELYKQELSNCLRY